MSKQLLLNFCDNQVIIKNTQHEKEVLGIDKFGRIQLFDPTIVISKPKLYMRAVGILGIIRLLSGYYIIVINEADKEGVIGGNTIYKVKSTSVVKIGVDKKGLLPHEQDIEEKLLKRLDSTLKINGYYFSYTYDLTSSVQRGIQKQQEGQNKYLWQNANNEFFFNYYLNEPLIKACTTVDERVGNYILPVINGFFESTLAKINERKIIITLITRRGRNRQGTRYFSRGADEQGNVSNYAETEQVVEFLPVDANDELGNKLASLVQIRGSVPLLWSQCITGRYKPQLILESDAASSPGFAMHFDRLLADYGDIQIVNLVDKRKYERPLGDAFQRLTHSLTSRDRVHYLHYDYHSEAKRAGSSAAIQELVASLAPRLSAFGSYNAISNTYQTGVVRTNCVDCLDRTNVVQSAIATHWLNTLFVAHGVLKPNDYITSHTNIDIVLRNIWADNADCVSMPYSGTGALKTDVTRTGKRSVVGMYNDLSNSITRYVYNNYIDGARQDAYDLFLGKFAITDNYSSLPLSSYSAIPSLSSLSVETMLVLGGVVLASVGLLYQSFTSGFALFNATFSFSSSSSSTGGSVSFIRSILPLAMWSSLIIFGVRLLLQSGRFNELLSWPQLLAYKYRPLPVTSTTRTNTRIKVPYVSDFMNSKFGTYFSTNSHINIHTTTISNTAANTIGGGGIGIGEKRYETFEQSRKLV
ncbi:Phosphoinositide phosphatase SAC1 [Zancudomyces culisetae]|uniref:Phosphoinositide phosphatase SAC1 n=1 Tax=Zancudomyces culisetae TaxID=1213189 RepID=A0A1R1PWS0_ZANCU|nr:Phosphoinositide phosphatase SAC1 [Zancudomyces culisetae]|eukprot:OMH85377.1 Phosphoinositide phosphatase SAC1 [Zancudomyces culisetae]